MTKWDLFLECNGGSACETNWYRRKKTTSPSQPMQRQHLTKSVPFHHENAQILKESTSTLQGHLYHIYFCHDKKERWQKLTVVNKLACCRLMWTTCWKSKEGGWECQVGHSSFKGHPGEKGRSTPAGNWGNSQKLSVQSRINEGWNDVRATVMAQQDLLLMGFEQKTDIHILEWSLSCAFNNLRPTLPPPLFAMSLHTPSQFGQLEWDFCYQ